MDFSLGRKHSMIKTRFGCRWRSASSFACVWGTFAWWCWWTNIRDVALRAGDLRRSPPGLWFAAKRVLSTESSRLGVTIWSHRNCKHLQTHQFSINFGSPQVPSTEMFQVCSCSSSSASSSGLRARNRIISPANFLQSTRWSSWDLYEESSSCCEDKPCPWLYQTIFISARRAWISSSFCGAGQKGCHFKGTQWWEYTCLRWCTYPCTGLCLDVWGRLWFQVLSWSLTYDDACLSSGNPLWRSADLCTFLCKPSRNHLSQSIKAFRCPFRGSETPALDAPSRIRRASGSLWIDAKTYRRFSSCRDLEILRMSYLCWIAVLLLLGLLPIHRFYACSLRCFCWQQE